MNDQFQSPQHPFSNRNGDHRDKESLQRMLRGEFVRNIAKDIILTLITCGLYNIYIQHKQMQAVNSMIGEMKYEFLPWLLLSIVTCGLYHIYHEWRLSSDIIRALNEPSNHLPLVSLIVSLFDLTIVADAIQQSEINSFYGSNAL